MPIIKGYVPKKKPIETPDLSGSIDSVIKTVDTLNNLKQSFDNKIEEVDTAINETKKATKDAIETIDSKVNEFEKTAVELIKTINGIPHFKGDQGKDADPIDQEKLIKDIIAKLPQPEKINEKDLISKVIKAIPSNKASLKIIQEKFETDPMSIIDKIMALPENKVKWKTSQIDGLDQTIRAFQSQLGRGYLHGGGLSKVSTDATLSGSGTETDPLKVVSGGASAFTDLTDVPHTYTGQSGKAAVVNGTEDGLVFATVTGTDEKVKYDASDPTAGYVADKIVAGTGINIAEGTGANENKLVVTNSAPDQTVSITGTGSATVTGTYPDFTIDVTSSGGDMLASVYDPAGGSQQVAFNGQLVDYVSYTNSTQDVNLGTWHLDFLNTGIVGPTSGVRWFDGSGTNIQGQIEVINNNLIFQTIGDKRQSLNFDLTNDNSYTFQDASGTIAFTSDITGTNSGTNTGDQVGDGVTIIGTGTTLDPFVAVTGGGGDVVGPVSSVDGGVALFDTTTGKLLKDGGVLGTAAFSAIGDFATSAQGALANTALQSLSGAAILGGIAGGQTLNGGTLTTQNLTLRANAANLTTGQVNITTSLDASSTSAASLTTAGGLGVAKRIWATDMTLTNLPTLGGTALTTTAAKLNYLTAATGTTGTNTTNIVFSTSPALTTPTVVTSIVGGATFAAFNTTTTNLSLGGAATTMTIGGTPTTTVTHSYSANATATGTTKTVNIATGGAVGSTTNVNIGSATASAILGILTLGFPTIVQPTNYTSLDLFNTQTTTLNLGGALTALSIGNTATTAQTVNMFTASTGASTYNFATGTTASATTKTLNLGTGGAASSTTNINIGSSIGGITTVNSPALATTAIGTGKVASSSIRHEILTNSTFTQGVRVEGDSTSRLGFSAFVTGDSQIRYTQGLDGKMEWGPGNAVTDVSLYRSAANTLTVGGGGKLTVTNFVSSTSMNGTYLTSSTILGTDVSKNIVSLPLATYPSLTELTYVKGLTSSAQTQLTAKQTAYTILSTLGGLGNSSGVLTNNGSGGLSWVSGGGGGGAITLVGDANLLSDSIGAGAGATGIHNSNFFGSDAGSGATGAYHSNFLGIQTGYNATNAPFSNFLGYTAGYSATNAYESNFIGSQAGNGATNANDSNFIGTNAGQTATAASNSNFLGSGAGSGATNASNSNFIGQYAGNYASNASNSIFLGQQAGVSDTVNNTSNGFSSILLGSFTNTGGYSNSILLGSGMSGSPISNTKANQFMLAPTVTEMRLRNVDYTLPSSQATSSGQVLTNDGSGGLNWGSGVNDDVVKSATISISSAQLKAINTTPQTLVAAPGSGKAISVDEIVYSYTYGGTAYTGGNTLIPIYAGGTTNLFGTDANSIITQAKMQGTTSFIVRRIASTSAVPIDILSNTAVNLYSSGNYATGNGTLKVFIRYRILTL